MSDETLCENFDFALTIQIPAFKKVEYIGLYKAYKDYDENTQKNIIAYYLLSAYNNNVSYDNQHYIELNFEKHKDGRIHLHTIIKCIQAHKMRDIQTFFCRSLGIKALKQSLDVFYYEPKYSDGWVYYAQKEQPLTDMEADLLLLNSSHKSLIVEF